MSAEQTTFGVAEAWELLRAVQMIELCDRAIAQYAEMGISGTPHDLEHQEMRAAAVRRMRKLRP
jgi:hypothetical protein